MIEEILLDAIVDTLKVLPFLFLTYLFMEYLENRTGDKLGLMVAKTSRVGPAIGAAAGVIPQCGFSAAAASLFSGGVITTGTLIAIFLSTSDEMLPIFLSERIPIRTIAVILGLKMLLGMVTGLVIDAFIRKRRAKSPKNKDIHDLCEHEHCHCGEGSILKSALIHTAKITLTIFIFTLIINCIVALVGEEALSGFLTSIPVIGAFLMGLVGLIPNCAASIVITQLYLNSMISLGQMMAGLLVGAGVGLLVLFRTNTNRKENLMIMGLLYASGTIWGLLLDLMGLAI